ncbi:MAG: lysophospholipid acyltransferase family protein [Burkholderiaceae bacterium]
MTVFFKLLSTLPLWLLHGAGWLLGWLVFLSSPRYRQRFLANAALAGYGFAAVRGAVAGAGRLAAESPRLWMGAPVRCEWDNEECIVQAYAKGRGILFLTPHLGCFEISAQAVAQRYSERFGPLTVLYRPARKPWLARLMERARARPGLQTAPTTLAGVRQMMRALRSGQAVGLLPDQVPPEGMGQWASFFGRDAYTMTLSARLAQQTGATVVLAWGERLAWGRGFCLHFREPHQPLATDMGTAVLQINQEMERLIRECPSQYLWAYARYKQPKRAA